MGIFDKQTILMLTLLASVVGLVVSHNISAELATALLSAYAGYILREGTSLVAKDHEVQKDRANLDFQIARNVGDAIKNGNSHRTNDDAPGSSTNS